MKVENLTKRTVSIDGISIEPGQTISVSEEANIGPLLRDGLIKVYNTKIHETPEKVKSKKEVI